MQVSLSVEYTSHVKAEAHRIALNEIEKILRADAGRGLHFWHLHGHNANDFEGLLLKWVVDQHHGQAKGKYHLLATEVAYGIDGLLRYWSLCTRPYKGYTPKA